MYHTIVFAMKMSLNGLQMEVLHTFIFYILLSFFCWFKGQTKVFLHSERGFEI